MMRRVLLAASMAASLSCASGYVALWPRAARMRASELVCSEPPPAPADMRLKALKEELDQLEVAWRGVAFEKDELVSLLLQARTAAAQPAAEPAADTKPAVEPLDPAPQPAVDASDESAYAAAYDAALADALKLKTKELRTELAARSVGWADLFEKEELAARLAGLVAQSALFSRSGALSPGEVSIVNAEQLRAEMADERTPLMVDVFATWCAHRRRRVSRPLPCHPSASAHLAWLAALRCGPCKMLAPWLEDIARKVGNRCRVAKLDSDEHPELSTELNVNGLPTILFLQGGKEVYRLEGVPPDAAALEQLASQYLGIPI